MSTILDALKKKYEAEIEEGKVNIKIMLNNPISIPEHSKFLEELDVHFGKIAEAEDIQVRDITMVVNIWI